MSETLLTVQGRPLCNPISQSSVDSPKATIGQDRHDIPRQHIGCDLAGDQLRAGRGVGKSTVECASPDVCLTAIPANVGDHRICVKPFVFRDPLGFRGGEHDDVGRTEGSA